MFWNRSWILIGVLFAALGASGIAQVATTQIDDTIDHADGTPASGTVLISWPAFTTADGDTVPAGSTTATLASGGALSVQLVPNAGATPIGTYYTAVYHLDDGSATRQYWVVPASGLPLKVSAIESTVLPISVAMQTVSKAYVDTAIATAQAGKPLSSSPLVQKSGDAMSGPLTLPADPVADQQAADKHYVDTSVAAVQAGIAPAIANLQSTIPSTVASVATTLPQVGIHGVLPNCTLGGPWNFGNYCKNQGAVFSSQSPADPGGYSSRTFSGNYYYGYGPGRYIGNAASHNDSWSGDYFGTDSLYFMTRGITQRDHGSVYCLHVGDCATRDYFYDGYDGGFVGASDEGVYAHGLQLIESQGYYHGTITSVNATAACAKLGSADPTSTCLTDGSPTYQNVQVALSNASSGPNHVTDGTMLMDLAHQISGCRFNGDVTAYGSSWFGQVPVTGCTLPTIQAIGVVSAETGDTQNQYTADTPVSQSFTVAVTSGTFVAPNPSQPWSNYVCFVGNQFADNPRITAISGSGSSITMTANLRYPNAQAYVIQGPACGPWYGVSIDADASFNFNSQASSYFSFGSPDGTHLLVASQRGATVSFQDVLRPYDTPETTSSTFELVPMAEIVSNNTPSPSSSPLLQLADNGLLQTTGASGDSVIDPHYENVKHMVHFEADTTSQFSNASINSGFTQWTYSGPGISLGYTPFMMSNANPNFWYTFAGGPLVPPAFAWSVSGAHGDIFRINNGPAGSGNGCCGIPGAVLDVASTALGGNDTTPFSFLSGPGGGYLMYDPAAKAFGFSGNLTTGVSNNGGALTLGTSTSNLGATLTVNGATNNMFNLGLGIDLGRTSTSLQRNLGGFGLTFDGNQYTSPGEYLTLGPCNNNADLLTTGLCLGSWSYPENAATGFLSVGKIAALNGLSAFKYPGHTAVNIGSGTFIDLGSDAYLMTSAASGSEPNAGVLNNRADTGGYASLDLITGSDTTSGWSLQMAPADTGQAGDATDLLLLDRVHTAVAMDCEAGSTNPCIFNKPLKTTTLVVSSLPAGADPVCPNGPGGALTTSGCAPAGPLRGVITLTSATSDSISLAGLSASSVCTFSPANAAATNAGIQAYYTLAAGTFTLNHAATVGAGAQFGVICAAN